MKILKQDKLKMKISYQSTHTKKLGMKKLYIYICICTVVKTSKPLSDLTIPMLLCSMVQDVPDGTAQQEMSKWIWRWEEKK